MRTLDTVWIDMLNLVQRALSPGNPFWRVCFGLVLLESLVLGIRGFINIKKRAWESWWYGGFCSCIVVWSGFALLSLFYPATALYSEISVCGLLAAAAFSYLHIRQQVSYKSSNKLVNILALAAPPAIIAAAVSDPALRSAAALFAYDGAVYWQKIVCAVYFAFMLLQSYMLCFTVFYQMPPHMRRSTVHLLTGVSAVAIAALTRFFLQPQYVQLAELAAAALAMDRFCGAFSIASSSNVIATSREFGYKALSTLVITLSRKGYILEWNKKNPETCAPLPVPRFKEDFRSYRARITDKGRGKASKHDENVFTINQDGAERHFQIKEHEISEKGRVFGLQVEISEVTEIFGVLRKFEDIAMIDQLTGLNNRNAYQIEANNIIESRAAPYAIVLGDANGLKYLNDTYGHLYGDKLLTVISDIIKDCLPEGGFAARTGGDEYVLLLPDCTDSAALAFVNGFKHKAEHTNDPEVGNPSVSWGFAVAYAPEEDYNEVYAKADAMMYEEKEKAHALRPRGSGHIPTGEADR
jgi:diguanylate cyclase (GGDEF)-like protein